MDGTKAGRGFSFSLWDLKYGQKSYIYYGYVYWVNKRIWFCKSFVSFKIFCWVIWLCKSTPFKSPRMDLGKKKKKQKPKNGTVIIIIMYLFSFLPSHYFHSEINSFRFIQKHKTSWNKILFTIILLSLFSRFDVFNIDIGG